KTSKKAYENCYGIRFFEISAVFDPADPTALTREVKAAVVDEGDTQPVRWGPVPYDEQRQNVRNLNPTSDDLAMGVPDVFPILESPEDVIAFGQEALLKG